MRMVAPQSIQCVRYEQGRPSTWLIEDASGRTNVPDTSRGVPVSGTEGELERALTVDCAGRCSMPEGRSPCLGAHGTEGPESIKGEQGASVLDSKGGP